MAQLRDSAAIAAKRIDEEIAGVERVVLDGMDDHGRYRDLSGYLRGLKTARQLFLDAAKAVDAGEFDED